MLELHHGEPTADTLKLLICLREKSLEFTSRYVDVDAFGQWEDWYCVRGGHVPVLVDDGEVMTDSALALQYLAEAYPSPRLAPSDPLGWYDLQAWNGTIDAALAASVSLLGWMKVTDAATREAYRRRLAAIPGRVTLAGWSAVTADAEANEDQLANARDRVAQGVDRIETALAAGEWLVGSDYSIADINGFALTHTLPRLVPDLVNAETSPRVMAWLARIGARPAVQAALATRRGPADRDAYAGPS